MKARVNRIGKKQKVPQPPVSYNIHITIVSPRSKGENGVENIKRMMTENVPDMMEDIYLQKLKTQSTLKTRKTMLRVSNRRKTKIKRKNLRKIENRRITSLKCWGKIFN